VSDEKKQAGNDFNSVFYPKKLKSTGAEKDNF